MCSKIWRLAGMPQYCDKKKQSYQKHPSFKVLKIWSKPGNIRGLDTPKDKFKLGGRMITVQPQDWNPASMCSQKGRRAASLNIYITHHGLLTTTSSKQNFWINCCWLVVYLPLWKIWVRQLGWWNSQYMDGHKIHVANHHPGWNGPPPVFPINCCV